MNIEEAKSSRNALKNNLVCIRNQIILQYYWDIFFLLKQFILNSQQNDKVIGRKIDYIFLLLFSLCTLILSKISGLFLNPIIYRFF